MCCCEQPTINGQLGYRWQPGDAPSVRPVAPPVTLLQDHEAVLYDEPGRCGGQDSHCHHYRIVGAARGLQWPALLVRNGGGEERIDLSNGGQVLRALALLDSDGRYGLLNALYHAQSEARHAGLMAERDRWNQAAAERRIRVRKIRNSNSVRVTFVPRADRP